MSREEFSDFFPRHTEVDNEFAVDPWDENLRCCQQHVTPRHNGFHNYYNFDANNNSNNAVEEEEEVNEEVNSKTITTTSSTSSTTKVISPVDLPFPLHEGIDYVIA
jgi:hypothetical protein